MQLHSTEQNQTKRKKQRPASYGDSKSTKLWVVLGRISEEDVPIASILIPSDGICGVNYVKLVRESMSFASLRSWQRATLAAMTDES